MPFNYLNAYKLNDELVGNTYYGSLPYSDLLVVVEGSIVVNTVSGPICVLRSVLMSPDTVGELVSGSVASSGVAISSDKEIIPIKSV